MRKSKNDTKEISDHEPIFAQGVCFKKLLFIFVIACIIGTYYEQILTLIKGYFRQGIIIWESRRGVIYGPISPIYGAGAVIMTYFLARKNHTWHQTFLYGAILGGSFEYIISYLQETFVGTVSWDYSNHFLNIHGRTTIPFMIFWGICAVIFVKLVYPFISNLIERIPYKTGNTLSKILVIFLSLDMIVSWTALLRQTMRRNGTEPMTVVGKFYDYYYTDEFLKQYFPNMMVKDQPSNPRERN